MKRFIFCLLLMNSWFTMHASHEKTVASRMPSLVERSMYNRLFACVDRGDLSAVQAYFLAFPCNINYGDEHGASLLMHAVRNHRIHVMIYLIYRKADIFHQDDRGMCPLTQAEWEDDNQYERGTIPLLPLLVRGWLLKTFPEFFEPLPEHYGS
jgi:hypothetical protein